MGTTDEHSPVNKAIGIPERHKFQDVVTGEIFECLACQERSPFVNNENPEDLRAYAWMVEHTKTHGCLSVDYFRWNIGRTRVRASS